MVGTVTTDGTITSPADATLPDVATGDLVFRIVGTSRSGQIIRLRSKKCTIGSSAGCTLRLVARGIRPVHCLILRGESSTVVRCWAPETRLNGGAFTDAPISTGDRLCLGPIELEILEAGSTSAHLPEQTPEKQISGVVEKLSDQRKTLEARKASFEQERAQFNDQRAHDEAQLREQEAQLREQAEQLRTREAELKTDGQTVEADRQSLDRQSLDRQSLEAGLKTSEQVSKEERQSLDADRQTIEAERRTLEAELQTARQALEKERQSLNTELDADCQKIEEERRILATETEADRQAIEAERRTLEAEMQTARQAIEKERQAIEKERQAIEKERQALEKERQTIEKERQSLNTERDADRQKIEEETRILATETEAARQAVEEERRTLEAEMQTARQTLEEERQGLNAELRTARQALAEDRRGPATSESPTTEEKLPGEDEKEEEDESIDDYMTRLLQRAQSRGGRNLSESTSAISRAKTEGPLPDTKPEAADLGPVQPRPYVPRAVAPEQSAGLEAMRAVATLSATTAISEHSKRQLFESIRGKLTTMVIGLVASCSLLWLWWDNRVGTTAFHGAAVGLVVVLLWGAHCLRHVLRLKSERSDGDDPPATTET